MRKVGTLGILVTAAMLNFVPVGSDAMVPPGLNGDKLRDSDGSEYRITEIDTRVYKLVTYGSAGLYLLGILGKELYDRLKKENNLGD